MDKINMQSVISGLLVGVILIVGLTIMSVELNRNPNQPIALNVSELQMDKVYLLEQVGYDLKKYNLLYKVVSCESSWNDEAVGDGGKALSYAQFHKPTFDGFKKEAGMPELNYENPKDQLKLMSWSFDNGKQNHWTCYKKLIAKK